MPKLKENIKLSILILSIPSRFDQVRKLIDKVELQIGDRQDVEVLCLMDNKSMHIWEKRNELMGIARGSHLTWLDDDDDIADNYVDRLTLVIQNSPNTDVISFNQICYLNGQEARVFAKMGNPHETVVIDQSKGRFRDTLRPPYHWCCWKTSLAASEPFRASFSHGDKGQSTEDIDWLRRLYPKVEEDVHVDEFLHIYRWSNETTESIL
jgi:hypothetical protein